MLRSDDNHAENRCPRCVHSRGPGLKSLWARWLLPVAGLLSLVWFLIRVLPKPSRAAYPCQRMAAPLASAFVIWLLGLAASIGAARTAKTYFRRSRYAIAGLCLAASVGAIWATLSITRDQPALAQPPAANEPIGTAQGIHPGRVVWVHDPDATNWGGPEDGHWWESNHTSQAAADRMISRAVCAVAGERDLGAAWDRIFHHFNRSRGKGNLGYRPGEKIMIKVNFVGLIYRMPSVDPATYKMDPAYSNYMNTSPQMILALLDELVGTVGVREADIALGDTLARFTDEYYEILHARFPGVRYLGCEEKPGRIAAKPSDVPLYWSCRPQGMRTDYVPDCFADAEYLINLANLKAHTGAGVTLAAKNHYGSLIRWPVEPGYYDLHATGFAQGTEQYRCLVDLMGHPELGGKTLLYLIDGLYCGRHPIDKVPLKWNSAPFNGDWTSSLLASQDPVAIDSVAFDFLWAEYDEAPRRLGADDYLHEAALADNPPSGTFYDPVHDRGVSRLKSLGVHEHWNNPAEKQYSRNRGSGQGIELVSLRGDE